MWRLIFGPSRFCALDAMFLGEGTRHFGCRFGLRISFKVSTCLSVKVSSNKHASAVPFKMRAIRCRVFKAVNLTFFAAFAAFLCELSG